MLLIAHHRARRYTSFAIEWPITLAPILSRKDQLGLSLSEAEVFED
jgi:dTDP-4-dehydrorhamnose 3,5-epimerase-like enzyme